MYFNKGSLLYNRLSICKCTGRNNPEDVSKVEIETKLLFKNVTFCTSDVYIVTLPRMSTDFRGGITSECESECMRCFNIVQYCLELLIVNHVV